jgi:hypothetical protein
MKLRAYLAQAMTGYSGYELIQRSKWANGILGQYGIQALDPVVSEGVNPRKKKIQATRKQLAVYWKRDKELIRQAHVVFDLTPDRKSIGVEKELGYARYFLYKPVIRVYSPSTMLTNASIAFFEDDYVAESLHSACRYAVENWGTPWQRLMWRIRLLKCVPQSVYFKSKEWVTCLI